MQAEQPKPEDLLLVDEMPDVRAGERPARRACAALVEGPGVAREAGVPEVEPPLPRERAARAGRTGRQDAVEHVDAAGDHLDHAFGIADAHEVARLLDREPGGGGAGGREHRRPLLADGEAADRVAVEVERGQLGARAGSQLAVEAALRDREAKLSVYARKAAVPLGPERRAPH